MGYCTKPPKLQIAYVIRQTGEICCWKERVRSRHLGCELCWQVWRQNPPGWWNVERSELRIISETIKIISVLSLFNCSWLFAIQAFTSEIQDWVECMILGSSETLPIYTFCCHQRNCYVKDSDMIQFRNRTSVKDKENRTKHWSLVEQRFTVRTATPSAPRPPAHARFCYVFFVCFKCM